MQLYALNLRSLLYVNYLNKIVLKKEEERNRVGALIFKKISCPRIRG